MIGSKLGARAEIIADGLTGLHFSAGIALSDISILPLRPLANRGRQDLVIGNAAAREQSPAAFRVVGGPDDLLIFLKRDDAYQKKPMSNLGLSGSNGSSRRLRAVEKEPACLDGVLGKHLAERFVIDEEPVGQTAGWSIFGAALTIPPAARILPGRAQ